MCSMQIDLYLLKTVEIGIVTYRADLCAIGHGHSLP